MTDLTLYLFVLRFVHFNWPKAHRNVTAFGGTVPVVRIDDQMLFKTVKSAFSYSRAYILLCSSLSTQCFCQTTDKVTQILEAITLSLYVGAAFKIWYAKSNEALQHNFVKRGTFFVYVFF